MHTTRSTGCALTATFLAPAGCANPALGERKQAEKEADIDEILSCELDSAGHGKPDSCLRDAAYRGYPAWWPRHLLFQGRQKRRGR